MPELRCIIADDEPLALDLLGSLLDARNDIVVVAACRDGEEALAAIRQQQPDLAFLDIEMPGLDGFEVVKRLQPEIMPAVIFTTAFNHYAIEAFEIHAVDYVLKPLNGSRLGLAIDRARSRVGQSRSRATHSKTDMLHAIGRIAGLDQAAASASVAMSPPGGAESLIVRDAGKTHFVDPADIDWVDAAGDYMCIHTARQTLVARMTMKSLEEQLDPYTFVRIHRSTLVNIMRIVTLENLGKGDCMVHLADGTQLKLSRRYRPKLDASLALI